VGRETNRSRRERQAQSAREKAAAARAVARRQEQRRRAVVVLSSIGVIAIVGIIIAVIAITSSGKQSKSGDRVAANSSVLSGVTSVSDATINKVGKGTDQIVPQGTNDPPLTANGKPEVLFIGAEFCPYCAAERWPLIQALSRFGTFSNLSEIRSSSTDVDANTPTFSFYKSSYSSKYLSLRALEVETRTQSPLESPTKAEDQIWVKYTKQGTFPFMDYGGKYVQTTQSFDPAILAGTNQANIASQLNNPNSTFAKAIVGGANMTTATLCKLTNNKPANVCTAPGVVAAAASLGS
jgi:thiol-disulfide isomerase/thioredoxin